jgi:hypothetical protein
MERLLTWMRDHPQLAALTFAVTVLVVLLTLFATLMTRSGLSLRPLIWFAGFFAIIAGPQAVVHLLDGLVLRRPTEASSATPSADATPERGRSALAPVPWATVFGPKADPDLISDPRRGFGAFLGNATDAKLSFNVDGESALAARFPSAADASEALNAYGNFFGFARASGSDATGWTARRYAGQGEWTHVVAAGPELYAWTGSSRDGVIANRIRALGPVVEEASTAPSSRTPELVSSRLRSRVGFMIGLVSLNVLAAGLWFFKGSAWSARIDAPLGISAVAAESLRHDLVALNQTKAPAKVTLLPDGTLEVDWRYADARWFDLMRVHQMKRTHRLVLILDEASRTVRVREYLSAFDASAGAEGLRLAWKAQTGIQFFAFEHKRVTGAQLASDGKPTGELSQAYTFNLQALKHPLIERVTRAGWRWQPVTWNAPASLRWLTE